MNDPVAAALDALGDPTRRELYERILARPSRIGALASAVTVTRPAVSHHVRVLKDAGLVREEEGVLVAAVDPLPRLRTYFDRLWFEASVGEGWLRERFAVSRRLQAMDPEAPAPRRSA
ncbi:helix-turn-helix transcriptional regulator [Phenylobacterium sp.]|uniref:ArsR/SmtB family transcription factor n=1 Tax=Phenylobacterium sp. TaxID=1871053 RepID=UPI0025D0EF81|nr:metalloregulator ArsR/SmtB family transcription factor [Phenylobacterium sp.]